jgi:hypothetical protein
MLSWKLWLISTRRPMKPLTKLSPSSKMTKLMLTFVTMLLRHLHEKFNSATVRLLSSLRSFGQWLKFCKFLSLFI